MSPVFFYDSLEARPDPDLRRSKNAADQNQRIQSLRLVNEPR
jgi:hypothetical protein